MSSLTWDSEGWLSKFKRDGCDHRGLRRYVWENTKAIVSAGGYLSPSGKQVELLEGSRRESSFYSREFRASFEPVNDSRPVTVIPKDCLDIAHEWVNEGLDVSVLNLASRRNPGGGVQNGSGAQEEYLFRCTDYYMFMYGFAGYAESYGLERSKHQYPLDRNFGGIFSPSVTVFRENEENGYKLLESVWRVNMIAVAGMNSPRLVDAGGEKRIAPYLVEGVRNKIRTIFRIACAHGQRNLVLGALGCGAFHNPPGHVAELFREVLCEKEFAGAFSRVCFAVLSRRTAKKGSNYEAFRDVLDGFRPNE